MRLTGLLAILLFLAIVFFAAPVASYAQSVDSAAPPRTLLADNGQTPVDLPQSPKLSRRTFREEQRDGVCFTMRTYVVARESRDSDAVRFKGYHECMPEWKLQMRTTDDGNPGIKVR
jgi:hypothetical protein